MDQGLRERRHNRPIDIAAGAHTRVRRDYDSSVPIIVPPEQAITIGILNKTLDFVFNSAKIKEAEIANKIDTVVTRVVDLKWPSDGDTLIITRGIIDKLSVFPEPQANGVTLARWEVGYWTERGSPLSQPGGKFLRCQQGMEAWITFRVLSYGASWQRGEEMVFIQAWGY